MKSILLSLLILTSPAWAGVHVCHLDDGRVIYQDVPCAKAPAWAVSDASLAAETDFVPPLPPDPEDVARAHSLAIAEIAAAAAIRQAEEAARQAAALRAAEEQRRRNDFYRRCRALEAMVKGYERTASIYWGDPVYQERATVAREQFGFECW